VHDRIGGDLGCQTWRKPRRWDQGRNATGSPRIDTTPDDMIDIEDPASRRCR
jgi:hypothetical protein